VLLCPLFLGLYALYIYKKNNFHILSHGQAYRSAQLDRQALKDCIQQFGIKTILNLRDDVSAAWHKEEKATAAEHGIQHLDFSFSEYNDVSVEELEKVVTMLRDAPKPVLIHCAAGADRTGLISALYKLTVEGTAPDISSKELSMWYGHVPLLRSRVIAMDNSFWRYVSNNLQQAEFKKASLLPKP
jgi:protein tyrosine/serine phosphatase